MNDHISPYSMTFAQLSFVRAVAKEGGFRKAAISCGVSQPTLSVQIQNLEESLGVQIFDRHSRPIKATPEGEKIVQHATKVLFEVANLRSSAMNETQRLDGDLHLGMISTTTPYLLPRFAPQFLDSHPEINLVVHDLQTPQILNMLDHRELDLAVVSGPIGSPEYREYEVCKEPFICYLSPGHELLQKKEIGSEDLCISEMWLLSDGHCFRYEVLELCDATLKKDPKSRRLWFESGSMETIRRIVDGGLGYTLFPYLAVESLITDRVRRFASPEPSRQLMLIHSRHYSRQRLVDLVLEAIRSSIPKMTR